MPLDPYKFGNMFARSGPDPNQRTNNLMKQIDLAERMKSQKDSDLMDQAVRESGGDYEAAKNLYLQRGGTARGTAALGDRAYTQKTRRQADEDRTKQQEVDDLKYGEAFRKMLEGADKVSPSTWKSWRADLAIVGERAGIDANDIPAEYDENFVNEARQRFAPVKEKIGGQEFWRTGREYTPIKQGDGWHTMSKEEKARHGLDPNGAYRQNQDGKVETIYSPTKGGGKQPAKIQIMDMLLERKIAGSEKEAWELANQAVQNPTSVAAQMARADFAAQAEAIKEGGLEQENAQTLDQFYETWLGVISQASAPGDDDPGAGSGAADLSQYRRPEEVPGARQAKDGQWYVQGQDGRWKLLIMPR